MSLMLCRPRTANGARVEVLEARGLLSVSQTAAGWTVITPSDDTRTIYVSSSTGLDSNNGLSKSHPVQTIGHAKSLIRDNSADHLLLKRGDRFIGGFGDWTRSGRSDYEPILIGAYGKGARPLINSGVNPGIGTSRSHIASVDNVVVMSLHFVAGGYDGTNGGFQTSAIHLVGQADHWLVEDVSIEGYKDNITLDANGLGVRKFTIRRSEILDAYVASPTVGNGHAQGMYVSGNSSNTLIEQNIFDHNGWKEGVAGAEPTWFNHSIYVNTGATGTVIVGNIIARSSLRGVLLRAGGVVNDNLLVQNPVGIQVGNSASRVTGNVILNGNDQPGFSSGVGIDVIALPSVRIASNIIAHTQSTSTFGSGIQIAAGTKKALLTRNIVYDWNRALKNDAPGDVTIRTNDLPNNSRKLAIEYTAPDRSLASYNASIGHRRALMGFINAIRGQSESAWDVRYETATVTQYIRDGFRPV